MSNSPASSKNLQITIEEIMKKTQYENFGEWVKNFALNLTNIWNEPSARMLDPSKDQTYDKNKHSAIIIGRGPSIKKHDHLKLSINV